MKKWLINLSIIAGMGLIGFSCGPSGEDTEGRTYREQQQTGREMEDVQTGTSGYDTSSGAEFSTDLGEEGEMNTGPTVEDGYTSEEDTTTPANQNFPSEEMKF